MRCETYLPLRALEQNTGKKKYMDNVLRKMRMRTRPRSGCRTPAHESQSPAHFYYFSI
jgi:hypothetical protein